MSNKWKQVGNFLKDNAAEGLGLVGSLLTGNLPGAIATGASLVASATGSDNPAEALAMLREDPQTRVRLKELAIQEEENIRNHLREMERMKIEDSQVEHSETQKTIRAGDLADDKFVRRTRPGMALLSLVFGLLYVVVSEASDATILATLMAPALVYMGLREIGKWKAADVMQKVANGDK